MSCRWAILISRFILFYLQSTKKYVVHDADGAAKLGDMVTLVPIKPISKKKRFAVGEILRSAN